MLPRPERSLPTGEYERTSNKAAPIKPLHDGLLSPMQMIR